MRKWIGGLVVGFALGAGSVLVVARFTSDGESPSALPSTNERPSRESAAVRNAATESGHSSLARIQNLDSEFERTAALYDLVRSADADAIEALLHEAEDALPSTQGTSLKRIIYSRYVQLDPRAAISRILARNDVDPASLLPSMVTWARHDLDAALAFAETVDEPLRRQSVMAILSTVEGLTDARQEAVAERFSLQDYLVRVRASAEAKTNPASAWQNALSMVPGDAQAQALWSIAYTWFAHDPSAALAALDDVPDSGNRRAWQRSLMSRWAAVNHDAALHWAISQPDSTRDPGLLTIAASAAAADSPTEVMDLATSLEGEVRDRVIRTVLDTWAQTDPEAAIKALADLNEPQFAESVRGSLVRRWAQIDAMAAFEWAFAQPASDSRSKLLSKTLAELAVSHTREALALATQIEDGARGGAVVTVLRQWGLDDPRAAAAWLDTSTDKTPSTVSAVVGGYTEFDPEEALEWLLTQPAEAQRPLVSWIITRITQDSPQTAERLLQRIDDPAAKRGAGSALIRKWIDLDPRGAVRAIARMDEDSAPELYQSAFIAWSEFDLDAAATFLNQVPRSHRDAAIQGVMEQALYTGNIAIAERMYERLDGEEERRRAATTIYSWLRRTDHPRAEHYRDAAGDAVKVETGDNPHRVTYR